MARYLIDHVPYDADDAGFQAALAEVYSHRYRPLCMCREEGVPMYVAKVGDHYQVRRMPLSALSHTGGCLSYEAPDELGGLGQLRGRAIQENLEDGLTVLNLGFPFVKGAVRKAPTPSEAPPDPIKAEKSKLSLLGMLHYLWHGAELTKWSPGMAGKRNWAVVRHHLYRASQGAIAKGEPVADRLYIPESFQAARKDEIASRRMGLIAKLMTVDGAKLRPLMILVGEVKAFEPARYDMRMAVRHSPDFPFFMPEEMHKRLAARYERELTAWNGLPDSHLMAITLFSVPPSGFAQVEEAALMLVDQHWLPIDGGLDVALIDALTRERRLFERGMRFNMPASKPIATAVLYDTTPKLTAMFLQPAGAPEAYLAALEEVIAKRTDDIASWVWKADDGAMPDIPPRAPLDASRRAAFRPLFLFVDESGRAAIKIVTISSPRREQAEDGTYRLVARPAEMVAELRHVSPLDCAPFGQAVHVVPDRRGWCYRRLSTDEANRLRELDTDRKTSQVWREARWASYLAEVPLAAEQERRRRQAPARSESDDGEADPYRNWCSGEAICLLAEYAPELAEKVEQALRVGRLGVAVMAAGAGSPEMTRELA